MKTKYFGDRNFYKRVLAISVPIMIQNGITNLVNVVDNVMVGTLGTEAMSGVSTVNQFVFIFNMIIFGAAAAAGIFTSQYYGKQDIDGVRYTFRIKIMINTAIAVIAALIMYFLSSVLISIFLHGDGSSPTNNPRKSAESSNLSVNILQNKSETDEIIRLTGFCLL